MVFCFVVEYVYVFCHLETSGWNTSARIQGRAVTVPYLKQKPWFFNWGLMGIHQTWLDVMWETTNMYVYIYIDRYSSSVEVYVVSTKPENRWWTSKWKRYRNQFENSFQDIPLTDPNQETLNRKASRACSRLRSTCDRVTSIVCPSKAISLTNSMEMSKTSVILYTVG